MCAPSKQAQWGHWHCVTHKHTFYFGSDNEFCNMCTPDHIAVLLTTEIPWRKQLQKTTVRTEIDRKKSRKHMQGFAVPARALFMSYAVSGELQAIHADD